MRWLAEGVRSLSPAYFGLVMATGIVSIASERAGFHTIAAVLLWLNAAQYLVLWVLTCWRLLRYHRTLFNDLTDHRAGPGFFSSVAGTGVLGNQLIILIGAYDIAFGLWIFGIFLWIILTYAIFTNLTIKETKPTIDEGITGAWLLAVVATQSIAVLKVRSYRSISSSPRGCTSISSLYRCGSGAG
jgi:tellurite resistance protein TehA-like permease